MAKVLYKMINLNNKKILLVRNDNIGDLVCTTPVIEAIKNKYPTTQLDIVVNSLNGFIVKNNPFVDTIYLYTKPKHKSKFIDKVKALFGKIKIMQDIKRQNYDAVIVFRSEYSKSAELFSRITKAKYKIGVKNNKGKDNFNYYIIPDYTKHEVLFCFDFVKIFGIKYQDEVTNYCLDKGLKDKYKLYKNFILFHISSRIAENQYNKEHFKQIIDGIEFNNILITSEPQDTGNGLWLEHNTKAQFIPTKSIIDLSALIYHLKLLITLDGGAMHIAPALGVKTIAISGKTNMDKWFPWGYKDLVLKTKSKIANEVRPQDVIDIMNKYI
jgi:ADP-heptose:LPS heptosyltransferase